MRIAFIVLLLAAALAQAAIDWQATISQGHPYRLTSIGAALEEIWPASYRRTVETVGERVPWLWDPVGRTLTAVPLAAALFALAAILWLTRRRARRV